MPIYEYKCLKCANQFEVLVRNQQQKPQCSKCGGKNVERKLSVFARTVSDTKACPARQSCPEANTHKCSGGCCGFK